MQAGKPAADVEVPLVVDLDGTLVQSDLLIESVFVMVRRRPATLLSLPGWLRSGRARLKAEVADRAALGIAGLPYQQDLLRFLELEKARGRPLILATAANERYAHQVAEHLGLFDTVLASDARTNLSGHDKLAAIRSTLGDDTPFDYAGDHPVDRDIWREARSAVVVGSRRGAAEPDETEFEVAARFPTERPGWRTWAQALRVYQWSKNALIFVPVLAAHEFAQLGSVAAAVMAFVAYSLLASSVYLLNDLADLGDDRQHPRKRKRPFAAGRIPLLHGLYAVAALVGISIVLALLLPPAFWAVLALYYAVTVAYSFGLKQIALVDVIVLAGLYTLRIIAGGAATGIGLSFWLMALSMFLFLSLAMAKRCTEVLVMSGESGQAPLGRGYMAADLDSLRSLGTAAGYTAVVILALYVNSPEIANNYGHPERIWLLCPILLYWISRIWLKTLRGEMSDDPIVFAARDNGSRLCLLVGAAVVVAAL